MGALCGFSSLPNLSPSLRVTSLLKKPHPKSSQGISEVSLSPSVTVGIPPKSLQGTPGPASLLLRPQPLVELRAPKTPSCTPSFLLEAQGCGGTFFLLLFHPNWGVLAPLSCQHPPSHPDSALPCSPKAQFSSSKAHG